MEPNTSKVAIVGAGAVGATLAYNLALKGAVTELALIDVNLEKAEAEILDHRFDPAPSPARGAACPLSWGFVSGVVKCGWSQST